MATKYVPRYRRYKKSARKVTLAKKVSQLGRLVHKVKPELKPFEAGAIAAVSNTGAITSLCIPTQGTTYINREGVVISPKSLQIRMQIEQSASARISFLRVIFFRGVRESGATYAVTDILQAGAMDQPLVWLARDRFQLLSDKVYMFCDTDRTGIFVQKNIKLSKKLTFTGNATGIQDGGIYMLLLSNEPTNTVSVDWHTRTTFTD